MSPGPRSYYVFYLTRKQYYRKDGWTFPTKMRPGDIVIDDRLVYRTQAEKAKYAAEREAKLKKLRAQLDELAGRSDRAGQEKAQKIRWLWKMLWGRAESTNVTRRPPPPESWPNSTQGGGVART